MFAFLTQRTYLQLFAAYALGIALMFRTPLPRELLSGFDALLIWTLLAAMGGLAWLFRDGWIGRAVLLVLVAAVGAVSVSLALRHTLDMPLRQYADGEPRALFGRVASIPKYQRGHLRFILDVDEVQLGDEYRDIRGRCFLFVKCERDTPLYYTDRVRVYGTLSEVEPPVNRGQFNYRRYLLQRGTMLTGYVPTERSLRRRDEGVPQPWAMLSDARRRLLGAVMEKLPPQLGQLAASVVYGDKVVELPEDLRDRWRRAGLTHIVVASGTQVSLIIAILALLLWRIGDNASWRGRLLNLGQFAVMLAAVTGYAAITGFETSIVRALVMGGVLLFGRLVARQTDGLTALAQAGLAVLLLNPLELLSAGFQLSFGATFGLIYGAGVVFPLLAHLTGWRQWLAQMFVTTAGAQLFVSPLLAAQFNQLSLWGLVSNLLAIPLSFLLLVAGAVASLGAIYLPGIGTLLGWIVLALSWLLDNIAGLFAALPGSNIAVPSAPWWWLGLSYLLMLLVGEWVKAERPARTLRALHPGGLDQRWRTALLAAVPALALLLSFGAGLWVVVPRQELALLALPRSEGYLWRTPTGRNMLFLRSTGLRSNHNADTVMSALRCRGINRLHGIVWLNGPPEEYPLKDYPAPAFEAGSELPEEMQAQWLFQGRRLVGTRLGRGRGQLDLLWHGLATEQSADGVAGVELAALSQSSLGTAAVDERLSFEGQRLVVRTDGIDPQYELSIRGRGLKLVQYSPPAP